MSRIISIFTISSNAHVSKRTRVIIHTDHSVLFLNYRSDYSLYSIYAFIRIYIIFDTYYYQHFRNSRLLFFEQSININSVFIITPF
jgi:hypothetical protein